MTEKTAPPGTNVEYQPTENPPPYEPHPSQIPGQPLIYQPGPAPTIINAVVVSPVGSKPTRTTCRQCRAAITTRVKYSPSTRTHLAALLLCLIGCWPCVCVPYCIDSCNTAEHYCPNCNTFQGSYLN